jgi:hypothetical protein
MMIKLTLLLSEVRLHQSHTERTGPIAFDQDDPLNPKAWSEGKRWYISFAATVGGNVPSLKNILFQS